MMNRTKFESLLLGDDIIRIALERFFLFSKERGFYEKRNRMSIADYTKSGA